MVTENYEFPHYCFDILELINICRSTNNEFNVYNLSEILQHKKTLMDDASSTYVKLCLIICSVFYLILFGSNIETNMIDVCECRCETYN